MAEASSSEIGSSVAEKTQVQEQNLTGNMSVSSLVLTVLAFSAPMVVVSGYMPLTISTAGTGAPFAFILTTIVLFIFAVGYLAITKYLTKTGNFCAYISAGLGKKVGLGSAFISIFSYVALMGGVYLFIGMTFSEIFTYFFSLQTQWWIWSCIAWIFVTGICHLNIEFSAKFMTSVMILEVLFIMIFNGSILFSGERSPLTLEPLLPTSLLDGNVILPLLFCIMVYIGLESTTVYRDEVKNPNQTIPKATYLSILIIGLLYTVTCYFVIAAYGDKSYEVAVSSPTGMFTEALALYTGAVAVKIKYALVVTSLIAALVSVNNVASRYLYALGRTGTLPKVLGKVHSKHGSPYLASFATQGVMMVILAMFLMSISNLEMAYASMAGAGTFGIIALMFLVSLSTVVWFIRHPDIKENIFKSRILPALSAVIFGYMTIKIFMNMELVIGCDKTDAWIYQLLVAAIFISGVALANYYQLCKQKIYQYVGE